VLASLPSTAVAAAVLTVVATGCAGRRPARPEPSEFVHGQLQRIVKGPVDRTWPAVVAALDDDGVAIEQADRARGTIACRRIRHSSERDLVRRLREIADTSAAARRGMRGVTEYSVEHTLYLTPAAADTALKIVTEIQAVDRSRAVYFGGGLYQVIPETYVLPSKGIVERQLFRRIAGRLFAAEEMLYYVGDLGYE
jgi:hypothetical protein